MGASWTVMGAGAIVPRAGYGCSGYALRPAPGAPVTLFDCGPGTIRALPSVGIRLEELERVVLSHYHLDHCLDVFALFFARRNPRYDPPFPLELIGPPGLAKLLARGSGTLGRLVRDPAAVVTELALDADGRAELERAGTRFACVANGHTDTSVSWRADLPSGESLAYTGDTPECAAVAELARGVDLFTIECAFPDDHPVPTHLTPSSAGRLARDAGCRRALLTHFYPDVDPEAARAIAAGIYTGPIELAHDGLMVPVRP
jgi:ribonuclease BN (tRNA processing enzyme)